jgi:hypothetical protein
MPDQIGQRLHEMGLRRSEEKTQLTHGR